MDAKYQIKFKIHQAYTIADENVLNELSKEYENIVVLITFLEEQEHQVGMMLRKYALKGTYHRLHELKSQVEHINARKLYKSNCCQISSTGNVIVDEVKIKADKADKAISCKVDPIGFAENGNIVVITRFRFAGAKKSMKIMIEVDANNIDANGNSLCFQ